MVPCHISFGDVKDWVCCGLVHCHGRMGLYLLVVLGVLSIDIYLPSLYLLRIAYVELQRYKVVKSY